MYSPNIYLYKIQKASVRRGSISIQIYNKHPMNTREYQGVVVYTAASYQGGPG